MLRTCFLSSRFEVRDFENLDGGREIVPGETADRTLRHHLHAESCNSDAPTE